MKKINNMTVFEPTDKCSLDEYSQKAATEVPELIKKAKEEVNQKVIEISENDIKQDNEIATLKTNYTNLQEQNANLQSQIKKDRENMINLEVEGQSIHIEDSSDLEGQLEVLGNVEQDTSIQGKNKLNLRQSNYTVSDVNVTKKGSTLTLNGTMNVAGNLLNTVGDKYSFIYLGKFKASTYRFSRFIISGKYSVDKNIGIGSFACYIKKKDETTLGAILENASSGDGKNIILQEDTDLYMQIFCNKGAIFDNYVLGFQLEEGDKTTDFEQFIPNMPSPEHLSEIRAVGDNINLLENKAKTTIVNGVTFTVNEDGTVVANGIATNVSYINVNTFPFIKNNDYALSGCPDGGSDNSYKMYALNVATGAGLTDDYGKGGIIKTGTDQTGTIRIRIASGYKADNLIFKPKLEKGTVPTSYSKYGQGSVEIKKQNKNLFNKVTTNDGKYINGVGNAENQSEIMCSDYIQIELNKNYYISGRNEWASIALYDENKIFIERIATAQPNGVLNITNNNCKYIKINALIDDKNILQLEEGKTKTEYAEHQEQTKILPIQKPMLEGDYFVKETDGWKEVHEWGKVILDGINNKFTLKHGGIQTSTNGFYKLMLQGKIKGKNGDTNNGICNYLKYIGEEYAAVAAKTTGLWWEGNSDSNYASLPFLTLDEANKWLQEKNTEGNPVYICYKLEIPTKLPCTPEQTKILDELDNFQTYKPVTNITTDSIAKLRLKYIADTKTYVDNKTSNLEQQVNTINQLLSTTKTSSILLDNLQTDIESEVL